MTDIIVDNDSLIDGDLVTGVPNTSEVSASSDTLADVQITAKSITVAGSAILGSGKHELPFRSEDQ